MRSFFLSVALCLGFAVVGCGSSTSDMTPQSACNDEVSALCNWANRCAGQAALTAMGNYTSVSDCITKMEASTCTAANVQCDTGTTFHAANAQACIDGTKNMACPTSGGSAPPVPSACDQVCQ